MPATVYDRKRIACGLSIREAARLHRARPATVKAWCRGPAPVPDQASAELELLDRRIDRAAGEAYGQVTSARRQSGVYPRVVELAIAGTDQEARALGWPCLGAHRAVLARAVALIEPLGVRVKVIPRGSTRATAAAAAAHNGHLGAARAAKPALHLPSKKGAKRPQT